MKEPRYSPKKAQEKLLDGKNKTAYAPLVEAFTSSLSDALALPIQFTKQPINDLRAENNKKDYSEFNKKHRLPELIKAFDAKHEQQVKRIEEIKNIKNPIKRSLDPETEKLEKERHQSANAKSGLKGIQTLGKLMYDDSFIKDTFKREIKMDSNKSSDSFVNEFREVMRQHLDEISNNLEKSNKFSSKVSERTSPSKGF